MGKGSYQSPKVSIDCIIEYLEKGFTISDVCSMFECSKQSVFKTIHKHTNYEERCMELIDINNSKKSTDRLIKKVESLNIDFYEKCKEGYSLLGLSKEVGIAPQTLSKYVNKFIPELSTKFSENGVKNKSNQKVTREHVNQMVDMSSKGIGIDSIGSELSLDGVTVRRYLIQELGLDKYKELHPYSRYTMNNGWNGKRIIHNGKVYQSHGEVEVAKILESYDLEFSTHKFISVQGSRYIPDFYVPKLDLYIEYAGMMNKKFYRVKFFKKVNDYSSSGLHFFVLNDETLGSLDSYLESILKGGDDENVVVR